MDELPSVVRGLEEMARSGTQRMLLSDVMRCDGIGDEQCVNCLRRTAARERDVSYWFIEPSIRDGECMDRRI